MISLQIQGDKELIALFIRLPDVVQRAMVAKMSQQAEALSEYVKYQKLSGQSLRMKTGRLRASIFARVYSGSRTVQMTVGSRGVDYAAIQEYGGTTRPHTIFPDKMRALRFVSEGQERFAANVHHPGSAIPGAHYLEDSVREEMPFIVRGMNSYMQEAIDGSVS